MKSKIARTIVTGLIATAVMTIVGLMAPYMGLSRMNQAEMLSKMMGISLVIGYLMHGLIGVIFASAYVYIFNPKVHVSSKVLKGLLFGLSVFVFAQVMMLLMGMAMPMPPMGDKMLLMVGAVIGHLVYGVIVALMVPNYAVATSERKFKTAHAY
ncbi:MAG TPA: DUF6789 family protein [Flavisolibacter sp.]|nr:DUF6789 family protein [Flavisolibacter sp.]HWJ91314.1 DUF6789 family protein [Flavisolibacter sp.]